jgi:hypothetical protein
MLGAIGKMLKNKGREMALDYQLYNFIGGKGWKTPGASHFRGVERCLICDQKFGMNDDLVQLRCGNHHIFHTACAARYFERNPNCPTCGTRISMVREHL